MFDGMEVEAEPEVTDSYLALSGEQRDVAAAHIELLAEMGHLLRMPHSRPLGQGLNELRFDMSRPPSGSATGSAPTR